MRLLLCLPLLASCSLLVERGHEVECMADVCPTNREFAAMVQRFDDRVPGFDASESLTIEWWPPGTTWQVGDITAQGYCYPWSDHIVTTDACGVHHELMHIHLWRATGDEDPSHETAPGPWDSGAQAAVDDLCAAERESDGA